MSTDLSKLSVTPESTILQAISCMDSNGMYVAMVVDARGYLLDTITDGDIRRAILAGIDLESPITVLSGRRDASLYPEPVTALEGSSRAAMIEIMQRQQVRHLPITDSNGRLTRVVMRADLFRSGGVSLEAVIMAGGYGTRLRPLTNDIPKPMLPLGEKPLLEHIVTQLKAAGINSISVTTHYKKELITDYFKDGSDFGIAISYVEESEPLGTAGALSLVKHPDGPLLVINGDIVTQINFGAFLAFHEENHAFATVGVRQIETPIPFGVVESKGVDITGITEKPVLSHFINAGVYVLSPEAIALIPKGQPSDMPDLINHLVSAGKRVVGFPITEYWLDIGQIEDYRKVQEESGGTGERSDE